MTEGSCRENNSENEYSTRVRTDPTKVGIKPSGSGGVSTACEAVVAAVSG